MNPRGIKWRQGRPRICELLNLESSPGEVMVEGWVRTRREGKGVAFLAVNDGSCLANLQVVIDASSPATAVLGQIGTGARNNFV